MLSSKFKLKTIDIICFFLFFSIVKIHAVPSIVQQIAKVLFLLCVFGFLISKSVKRMKNEGLLLSIVLIIPSFVGIMTGHMNIGIFSRGILNSFVIYVSYTFLQYAGENRLLKKVLDDFFYLNVFACTISLISVLKQGRTLYGEKVAKTYFFGNKFATLYLFIFLIGLTFIKLYNERRKTVEHRGILFSLILLELFLSYYARCMTTMISGIILFLTIMFAGKRMEWIRKVVSNPIAATSYMIIPGIIALNMTMIMQVPQISHFVTDTLGKSVGLTGRTYIYSRLLEIFYESPIWGYGYNSDMVNKITEVGNAQNGLFQLLVEFGIIGTIFVAFLIWHSFSVSQNSVAFWGIKVFIFTMCVCSIVEISFGYLFFLGLFILEFSQTYRPTYTKESG